MTCKAPLDIYIEVHAVCARRQEYLNLCFPRCNGDMGHQGAGRASDKVDRFYSLSNMSFVSCKKFRDFHSRTQVQAGLKAHRPSASVLQEGGGKRGNDF